MKLSHGRFYGQYLIGLPQHAEQPHTAGSMNEKAVK
jgi:hypothetical protein